MKNKLYYICTALVMICILAGISNKNVIADDNGSESKITYEDEEEDLLDSKIEFTHLYPTELKLCKDGSRSLYYENVSYHVDGNQLIIRIPYSVSESKLKNICVQATIPDGECIFNDGSDFVDLTNEVRLSVSMNDGRCETYFVSTEYLTGDLPVLYLSTDDGCGVNSRTEYVSGNLVFEGVEYPVEVRGRGNVSWWGYDQHGYMLKFDKNVSFFGMLPSDKFCVLSTYGDTSLVRNIVAMNMASCMDKMEYVPNQRLVDMFIDGEYYGVFTFSEKIDIGQDKVNLFSDYTYEESLNAYSDDDPYDELAFLIELGGYSRESVPFGPDHFSTAHIHDAFIKYPSDEKLTYENSELTKSYIRIVDAVLTNRTNYLDYIELDDWVDWFIVMEYTNSTDSAFQRSTYLYKRPGSKLFLGPVWDFDKALGNYGMDNPKYDTWCSAESDYATYQFSVIHYLYMSDTFMEKVRDRWDEKKDEMKMRGLDALDDAADDVAFSRVYNDMLYHKPGAGRITQIRNFLTTRYNWIEYSTHSYNYNRHPIRPTIKFNNDEEVE